MSTAAKPRPSKEKPTPSAGETSGGTEAASAGSASDAPATGSGSGLFDGLGAGNDSSGGQPIERVGSAVSVVTGEQLRAQQVRNAADALRSLPGVDVSRVGGFGSLTQVRIRGAEAHHTLVLIDGVVANSGTDGEFDFSDLMAEDIERIEVIRGPQSALYGSGALGGVVNVMTRGGRGPLTMMGRVETGAFGTTDLAARVSGGSNTAWASATIHERKVSGFNTAPDATMNENDSSKLTTISANAGFRPFSGVELTFTARRIDKEVARDDQTGLGAGSNRNGLIVATDSLSRQNGYVLLLGTQLRWDMLDGALTHIVRLNRNVTERHDLQIADFGFGVFPSPFDNRSEVNTVAYESTYRFATPMLFAAKHSVTGLIEHEGQEFQADTSPTALTHQRERLSYAGEWKGEFINRLDLVAGVRHDSSDVLPDYTTWRSSASLRVPELFIRPHASAGTAVKLPSQFEQFGAVANFVSNPTLVAERSFGWDGGVEFTLVPGKAVVDVTYFAADLQDKITSQFASIFQANPPFNCNPGDFFCSRSINLDGTSTRKGLEVASRLALMPGVTLGLSYTRLHAVDRSGEQETRRPANTARADLNYAFDNNRGLLSVAAVYNGKMTDTAFQWPTFIPEVTTLQDYWLLNVAASYKVAPGVELFGRVENALNQKYEEVYGFNTAGIAAYGGVKLSLDASQSPPDRQ